MADSVARRSGDEINWLGLGSKTNNGERICSFCARSQAAVKKLIAGPNVHICDECARRASESALPERTRKAESCNFCGQPRKDVPRLVSGSMAAICADCLELAMAIVDEEESQERKDKPPA